MSKKRGEEKRLHERDEPRVVLKKEAQARDDGGGDDIERG